MTIKDAIESNNYNHILVEERTILPKRMGGNSIFTGLFRYEDGFIISLDDDIYSLDDEIVKYEYDERQNVLVIYRKVDWDNKED